MCGIITVAAASLFGVALYGFTLLSLPDMIKGMMKGYPKKDLVRKSGEAEKSIQKLIPLAKESLTSNDSFKKNFKSLNKNCDKLDKLLSTQKGYVDQWNKSVNKGYSVKLKELIGAHLIQLYNITEKNQAPTKQVLEILKETDLKDENNITDIRAKLSAIKLETLLSKIQGSAGQFNKMRLDSESQISSMQPEWYLKLAVTDGVTTRETPVATVIPTGNYFNFIKLNNLLFMLLFSCVILLYISQAKKKDVFLRRIAGLDAVEEAIGRATEMGRPIYFLTGRQGMGSISTIAATVILGEIAKRIAAYETPLKVPHTDVIVMAVCQEITKESYIQAGHPDGYNEDINFYVTDDQFGYAAAVDGMMLRDKPAACFYMGYYYAESLLLAETGHGTGAIQIAGTDAEHQLPFFMTACDYTLIGEELYAASAYLSREPVLLGTLRGQDLGKAILIIFLIVGVIIATLGVLNIFQFPELLELFRDF